jgi:hypothetical protein
MTDISEQRSDEIMILKKGGMQLDVSLLVFSTSLPLTEIAYLSEIVIRVPVDTVTGGLSIFFSLMNLINIIHL